MSVIRKVIVTVALISWSVGAALAQPVVAVQSPSFAFGGPDGALVCPTYALVQTLSQLYGRRATQAFQDRLTHGETTINNGVLPEPEPSAFGCSFVPTGTRMTLHTDDFGLLHVTAIVNNHNVAGITDYGMFTPALDGDRVAPYSGWYFLTKNKTCRPLETLPHVAGHPFESPADVAHSFQVAGYSTRLNRQSTQDRVIYDFIKDGSTTSYAFYRDSACYN